MLRSKGKLRDSDRFRRVYLRSSKSHEDRLLEQHTYELLKLQGKADDYTFTGSGKLVRKTRHKEQSKSDTETTVDPELLTLIHGINHSTRRLKSPVEVQLKPVRMYTSHVLIQLTLFRGT